METLKWWQDAVGLHVSIDNPGGANAVFTIGNTFVNFLMAGTPRMYIVYVKMDGCYDDKTFVLDLESLRPVINKTNGLKISKSRKSAATFISNGTRIGMYCLARGESYSDRFLGDNGWQPEAHQRYKIPYKHLYKRRQHHPLRQLHLHRPHKTTTTWIWT